MTAILGISAFYHDSAAALVVDGDIIAAAQEERFTRKKHDPGYPQNAISYVLSEGGLTLDQVDYVAFYDKPFLKFERLLETYVAHAPKGFKSFSMAMPVWLREKLFLKGDRCMTKKCAIEKRDYPPGQHGRLRRGKVSKYNIQLREKQKLRRTYGLLEQQFRNYFFKAARQKGVTGTNLLFILERRLDNVVFRLGLCSSRAMARQLIRHNHFQVNGKRVNIPSYLLMPGDRISPSEKSKNLFVIQESLKNYDARQMVSYLEMDVNKIEGQFLDIPSREAIPVPVNEYLIVELYSK